MGYVPELGQAAFGTAWSEYELPDSQCELLWELGEAIAEAAGSEGHSPMSNSGAHWVVPGLFEAHAYFWGDCSEECGFEAAEAAWGEANPHAADCFAARLAGFQAGMERDGVNRWTDEGQAMLAAFLESETADACDCGRDERQQAWLSEHGHDPSCGIVRPNFRHEPSGLEVRWYKHASRGTSCNTELDDDAFAAVVEECKAHAAEGHDPYAG